MEGFFSEIDHMFTKDLTKQTGHNLNEYNDLLRGGFFLLFGLFELDFVVLCSLLELLLDGVVDALGEAALLPAVLAEGV